MDTERGLERDQVGGRSTHGDTLPSGGPRCKDEVRWFVLPTLSGLFF